MNPTLVLELVLIQTSMIVKNDYERSRSRSKLAKEAGSKDKNNLHTKLNLTSDCIMAVKLFMLISVL